MVRKTCSKPHFQATSDSNIAGKGPAWLDVLRNQANRCTHLANSIAAANRGKTTGTTLQITLEDIANNTKAVKRLLIYELTNGHRFIANLLDSLEDRKALPQLDP